MVLTHPKLHLRLVGVHNCAIAVVVHMDLDDIVSRIALERDLGMGFEHLVAVVKTFRGAEAETGTFLCKASAAVLGDLQPDAASPVGSDFVDRDTVRAVSFRDPHHTAHRASD